MNHSSIILTEKEVFQKVLVFSHYHPSLKMNETNIFMLIFVYICKYDIFVLDICKYVIFVFNVYVHTYIFKYTYTSGKTTYS